MKKDNYISVFDFIALLLSDLGEKAFTRYAGIETKSYVIDSFYKDFINGFLDEIKAYYTDKGKIDYNDLVRKGVPSELYDKYIANTGFRKNTDAVFMLARSVSGNLLNYDNLLLASREAGRLERFDHKSVGFSQLNSDQSVNDTSFLLIPNLGTFGDEIKINKTTTTFEKILLNGLIVLTRSDLKTRNGQQYSVRNILPEEGSHLRGYPEDKTITIAVSPICDRWLLRDEPLVNTNEHGTKEYCFQCEGVTDEEFIHNRVEAAFQEACEKNAHILVFPEMYGTSALSNCADDVIDYNIDQPAPIVVMPSWWHDNRNEAPVLDDSLGVLFKQAKHSPFLYDKIDHRYHAPSLEDIKDEEHIVYLLHIPQIGRVCVCICKDFLMDSYRRMLSESLEASFILIPAFTPEIDHFKNCMGELRHAGSYGVFINCCAARTHGSDEYTPITNSDIVGEVMLTRSVSSYYDPPLGLLYPRCDGKCDGRHTCCVFIVRITHDGFISVEHVYRHSDKGR